MKTKLLSAFALITVLASCSSSKKAVAETNEAKQVTLTPELAQGKELFDTKCGKCHKLPNTANFSAEEWEPIMLRMQKKAKITDEERVLVYNYVTMQ